MEAVALLWLFFQLEGDILSMPLFNRGLTLCVLLFYTLLVASC